MNLAPYKKLYGYTDGGHRVQHCHLRPQSDVFECDPFKVHSFNFHYAERPDAIPLRNIQSRCNNNRNNDKRFETYYYNHSFNRDRYDKENYNSNKFHEGRRRKFLHDHSAGLGNSRYCPISHRIGNINSSANINLNNKNQEQHYNNRNRTEHSYANYPRKMFDTHKNLQSQATNSPLLKSVCNRVGEFRGNVQNSNSRTSLGVNVGNSSTRLNANRNSTTDMRRSGSGCNLSERRGSSNNLNEQRGSACNINVQRSGSTQSINGQQQKVTNSNSLNRTNSRKSVTVHRVQPKSTSGSFCNININIKGLEDQNNDGNVTIEIETDLDSDGKGKLHTINTNNNNQGSQHRLQQTNSCQNLNLNLKNSNSFVIDKRLSKFSIKDQLNNDKDHMVSTIYRDRNVKPREMVVTQRGSKDRVPTVVGWQPNNLNACNKDASHNNDQNGHMRRLGERFNHNYNDLRMSQQKVLNKPSEDNLHTLFNNRNLNNFETNSIRSPRQRLANNGRTYRENSPMTMNIIRLPRV